MPPAIPTLERRRGFWKSRAGGTHTGNHMNRKLLLKIQDIFHSKLQAKTGWGRNEIMDLYRDSVNEADDKP